jgi:hypothetical protein
MSIIFHDTHPEIERLQIQLLRQAPVWRKMQMVSQLNAAIQTVMLSGLRQRFPKASESELRRRLADLLLGQELAEKIRSDGS